MSPTLEIFFELSSPYSYLAATQVEALAERTGAQLIWKPMVLGAVFKETSNSPPAQVPYKGRYMLKDLYRWASHYDVPFTMPSVFPFSSITAHRTLLAAERNHGAEAMVTLTHALYRAYWGEGRDLSSKEVLGEAIDEAGLDAASLIAATQDPEIKLKLRQLTAEAIARGVFGAPTLFVGDEMFWGNDRFHFIEEALRAAT